MGMRGRSVRFMIVPALLALAAAACTAQRQGGGPTTVSVTLTEFAIALDGNVSAGKPIKLQVGNRGSTVHNLAVEIEGQTYRTGMIDPGRSALLELPALEAVTYKLWCEVPGHREAGMQSDLVVGGQAKGEKALTPEEIDRAHEAGVKAFPAKTEGLGGQVLEPKIVDGVKVFEVTAKPVRWEVAPGKFVQAFAYNGQVPGPEIRVRKGDRIRLVLKNALAESTSVHFHGMEVPNEMDGVPYITQAPVKPGESFTYEFTVAEPPGTYMYHSHHNALAQVGKGLLGALIVEPDRRSWDVEQTMILGDGPLGYTLNGKGFPATQPIAAKPGQRVLVRFLNEGLEIHPMHLHGFHFEVFSRDGRPVTPFSVDTLAVAPGERYDVIFTAAAPGVWAFHCHILTHVESEHGMHGMVTAVVVK